MTATENATPCRRALIVVDVQNDFCEGGALAVAGGTQVAADLTALLEAEHGYQLVVATADWHHPHGDNGGHFATGGDPDFVDTWPGHCIAGTAGAAFHPALQLPAGTAVFRKGQGEPAFSGFQGVACRPEPALFGDRIHGDWEVTLSQWLAEHDITAVDVVGLAFDFCVKATALDAAAAGLSTRVLLALTAPVAAPLARGGTTADTAAAELTAAGVELVNAPARARAVTAAPGS